MKDSAFCDAPGVYVHVPFCRRVCPYCDFAVQVDDRSAHERWLNGVLLEAERRAAEIGVASTIYLGGGTPSALDPRTLQALLEGLRHHLALHPLVHIAMEVNPEDADRKALSTWRKLGIAGLSFGVQSFDAVELKFLGRAHDPARARAAVEDALGLGFPWVSLDLIYGLPGQELRALRERIRVALELRTPHLSAYQLTIEPGTHFDRRVRAGRLQPLPEREEAEAFHVLHAELEAGGLHAYEVSNFARTMADRSVHNQKYWRHRPYLGLGPGAHSFDGARRAWNPRALGAWLDRLRSNQGPEGHEDLSAPDLAFESVMLALRTADGLDLAAHRLRFGRDLGELNAPRFRAWSSEGLVRLQSGRLQPTRAGLAVAEALAVEIEL